MIKKMATKRYRLLSKDGKKNLGTYNTPEEAAEREKQVQFFKALKKQRKPK